MVRSHTVQDGECLSSLAARYGFRHWRTIYDAPENEALRLQRPNPNLLAPGDVVAIPDREERIEEAATTQRHTFRVRQAGARVRIFLAEPDGAPRAAVDYLLTVDGEERSGKTDGAGFIDEPIHRDATIGTLTVEGETWELRFGSLPPPEPDHDIASLRRLSNLGYGESRSSARAQAAIARFEQDHELLVDGELDADTLAAINTEHGC